MHKHGERTNAREDRSTEAPGATVSKTATDIGQKLDALLDEIDGVLERNANEFVASYVQHGGE